MDPSGFADYFDNVMAKFIISNRTDALRADIYYINTSETPGELSRENLISLHVKITCYLHT